MTAFGAYLTDQKGEWPPFASYIAFETLKNDNGLFLIIISQRFLNKNTRSIFCQNVV